MAEPGRPLIRVCHVITMLELGGAQQNTLYTCEHLDPARFQATLIAGQGGYLDAEARRRLGRRLTLLPQIVREIRPWKDVSAYSALRRAFVRMRPHIVHTHSSKAGILGRAAARAARVPVVIHSIHGFPFNDFQPWLVRRAYLAAERLASKWTTEFVAVAGRNVTTGERLGLFRAAGVRVIRSGFDLDAFAAASSDDAKLESLGIPRGMPIVGTISCLKPQKAPLDFVDVCARVSRQIPDVHFVLIGDGALRGAVEARVERAGIAARFHLLGWRDDVASILPHFRVFVLTSLWEGLPRAVLQARAAGVPVVATAVDGTAEAIEDGVSGCLCRPRDIEGLAARVVVLLRDSARARALGARGRIGLEEFRQEKMVKDQESLYEDLLAARNPE